MLHIALHFLIPFTVAAGFYRHKLLAAFALMMLGMLIDIDHLLANPIYDPGRCSIGLLPLHTIFPIGIYISLFAQEKTRLLGLGLCIHIALDIHDCLTSGVIP